MAKSPGRSVSAGAQTAALGPSTFKCETVGITSFITSVERLQNIVALFATVALTENDVFCQDENQRAVIPHIQNATFLRLFHEEKSAVHLNLCFTQYIRV